MQREINYISVYYDGKCGLCAKEIAYYTKIAPSHVFRWVDITVCSRELKEEGISLSDGLKLLHVKDKLGKFHVGVDAFVCMWRALPRWRYLAYVVSLPGVNYIANIVYHCFANWRFKRLAHCQLNQRDQ